METAGTLTHTDYTVTVNAYVSHMKGGLHMHTSIQTHTCTHKESDAESFLCPHRVTNQLMHMATHTYGALLSWKD